MLVERHLITWLASKGARQGMPVVAKGCQTPDLPVFLSVDSRHNAHLNLLLWQFTAQAKPNEESNSDIDLMQVTNNND